MDSEPTASRIGLRDIAKCLGVSHVTVSRALRGSPRVSASMKERIQKLAAEMGYRPDPMLSAFATYRARKSAQPIHSVAAWINAWPDPEQLRCFKEFDLYWKGASECAEKFGHRLEEFRLNKQMTPQRLHQIFQARNIRGILLPPHGPYQPDWQDFPWDHYAVARFGRSLKFPQAHLVTADQLANTFAAVEKMRERGYQRIGLLTFEVDLDPLGSHFTAGFLSARDSFESEESLPIFTIHEPVTRDLVARFHCWMEKEKPDALLSTVEHKILLRDAGYRVPEDIAVAASSILDGGVDSGIDQHPEEIGRVAFLLLYALMQDGAYGIPKIFRQILVEGSWVDGSTLPDRKSMIASTE